MLKKTLVGIIFFLYCFQVRLGLAEEQVKRYDPDQGVKKFGVVFNIADDRQIENVGGLHEPEGLDKYIKRHLDQLALKLDHMETKLDELKEENQQILILLAGLKNDEEKK